MKDDEFCFCDRHALCFEQQIGAIATDGHNTLAMLKRREGETLGQLLTRLDLAIGKAFTEDVFTDEINTPLKNSYRR